MVLNNPKNNKDIAQEIVNSQTIKMLIQEPNSLEIKMLEIKNNKFYLVSKRNLFKSDTI